MRPPHAAIYSGSGTWRTAPRPTMPRMTGFLPFGRGSLMMDLVVVAMAAVIPALIVGIRLAKAGRLRAHKAVNGITALVLILAVVGFEIDVRVNGWREAAMPSPYYETWVFPVLYVHLVFAVSSLGLLIATLVGAWRGFPDPPAPAAHSRRHRLLGKLTFIDLCCTTVTGWLFYYLAFVA